MARFIILEIKRELIHLGEKFLVEVIVRYY